MRRNNRKWLWWGAGILLIAVITTVIILIVRSNIGEKKTHDEQGWSQTEVVPQEEESEKDEKEEPVAQKEEIKQFDGEDPNKSEDLTGSITYAEVMDGALSVRVNIDQFLTSGNCRINILKDGVNIYNNTVAMMASVSTSTCDGFTIPTSELAVGDLKIEVILESGGKQGKIVGEATI